MIVKKVVFAGWLSRLGLHLLAGYLLSVTVYPRLGSARKHVMMRRWSQKLFKKIGGEVRAVGFPEQLAGRPVTLVANHISWLDIFALNSERPSHFIAKSELRHWPIAGRLLNNVGTIFIDRGSRRDAQRLAGVVHELMASGETVAVFPEGTTSNGRDVLKFSAAMLEPVVSAGGEVWVVAIRYFEAHKESEAKDISRTEAAAYIDEMSLLDSLRTIFGAGKIVAELTFVEAIDCDGKNRREVGLRAEEGIRAIVQDDAPAAPVTN